MSDRDAGRFLLPRLPIPRGARVTIRFDGEAIPAHLGETVAAALVAAGHRVLRRSPRANAPRGFFCGTGDCFECLIRCDGEVIRACRQRVAEGMDLSAWRGEDG